MRDLIRLDQSGTPRHQHFANNGFATGDSAGQPYFEQEVSSARKKPNLSTQRHGGTETVGEKTNPG
jgi:hypothetical protein